MRIRALGIIILLTLFAQAREARAANTGASFLNIGTSARAVSMGNAFVGIANDISAINYNPAGLTGMSRMGIAAQHTEWVTDIRHDFMGFAAPAWAGVMGVSVIHLSQGTLESRDENRQLTGDFSAVDTAVSLSFAERLSGSFSGGMSLKIISERIESNTATGVAVDLGGKYRIGASPMSVGVSVLNLGPQMKYISEGYDLPLSVSAGLGYNIGGLLLAFDVKQQVHEGKTSVSFGTEYMPVSMLSLRAGYLLPLAAGTVGGKLNNSFTGIGAGLGLRVLGANTDYAFVPYGDLGNTHRLSFTFPF